MWNIKGILIKCARFFGHRADVGRNWYKRWPVLFSVKSTQKINILNLRHADQLQVFGKSLLQIILLIHVTSCLFQDICRFDGSDERCHDSTY